MKRKFTVFERLAEKIKQDCNVEVENIERTYVGRNMKACGANVWLGNEKGSTIEIGGATPASTLIKAKKLKKVPGWSLGQYEIVIDSGKENEKG